MLEAPNLLDLFANHRKDAQAKASQPQAADAKGRSATRAGSSDLLPIETSGKASAKGSSKGSNQGKGAASTPSSFQSKIKESRAKLAASAQKAAHQNRTPEAMTDKPAAKNETPRPEGKRSAHAEQSDRADQSRSAAGKPQNTPDAASADKPASRPEGFRADQNVSRPQNEDIASDCEADGGAESDAALKQSLADAGIHASEEQLQDPDMLAEILAMLQGMFLQQGLEFEAAPDASATTGMEELPVEEVMPQAPSAAPEENRSAQTPADAPSVDKDVFALVQEKIAQLARNNAETQDGVRPQTSPVNTPAGWQGIKVRPQTESVSLDPLPMADLDRLRVMQASALQAAAGGKESEIMSVELPGDEGTIDAVPESGFGGIANAGKESSGEEDAQAQADLFGRNGDTARNADASASKDGPLVAKEGATGQLFHNTMEHAKSVEHRGAGIERAWEPRQAHDASAMEQLASKLSAKGLKNGDEISVQLSPEHLGKVRVSLEMKEGSMSARISVENDAARQQVEAGLATLRDSLESQGIKLQGLEVSVDQRQSSLFNPDGSNSESFFQRNGRGQAGTAGAAENLPFESAPESDTGRRMGYNTMEYIG